MELCTKKWLYILCLSDLWVKVVFADITKMPGYRIHLEEGNTKDIVCVLCLLILRAPVQTCCGHRCCLSCVKEKRGSSGAFFCPVDGTEVTEVCFLLCLEILFCYHSRNSGKAKGIYGNVCLIGCLHGPIGSS